MHSRPEHSSEKPTRPPGLGPASAPSFHTPARGGFTPGNGSPTSNESSTIYTLRQHIAMLEAELNVLRTRGGEDPLGLLNTLDQQMTQDGDGCLERIRTHLSDQDSFLAALFNDAPEAILLCDATGIILDLNPGAEDLFGYTRDQLVGRSAGCLEAHGRTEHHERIWAEVNRQGTLTLEGENRRGDGSLIHVETRMRRLQMVDSVWFLSFVRNITARVRALRALERSQERYRNLIENSHEAVWRLELVPGVPVGLPVAEQVERILGQALLAECNDRCAQDYGHQTAAEVEGSPYRTLLDSPDAIRPLLEQFVSNGHRLVNRMGISRRRSDGPRYWQNNAVGIIEKGRLVRIWGNHQDVTDSERMRQKLVESEAMARAVADMAPVGIFRKALDGTLNYANPQAEAITGLQLGSHTYRDFLACIPEPDRTRINDCWNRTVTTGTPFREEHRLIRSDGSEVWVIGEMRPVPDESGLTTAWVGTLTDITEARRRDAEMLKMQKLESVGTLAGGIAHDFNNLLTGILGSISLAQALLPAGSDRLADVLHDAGKSCDRATRLTQQLLTFSRGGAPVTRPLQMDELIQETLRFSLRGMETRTRIDVEAHLPCVQGDESQLYQVLHSLVTNSIEAMQGRGTLLVNACSCGPNCVPPPGLDSGRWVRIQVQDDGPGIDPSQVGKIFDPYYTTKEMGNGLGLATSYSIIKKHGGVLRLAPGTGHGACFEFWLPVADSASRADHGKGETDPGGPARVLVMDDEETIRSLMKDLLGVLGCQADTVPDGASLIARLEEVQAQQLPYDLIFMDLTVPGGMGGREAARIVQGRWPGQRMVVMSGYSDDPVMSEHRAHGFEGRLGKPFQLDQLRRVIGNLVETRRSPAP